MRSFRKRESYVDFTFTRTTLPPPSHTEQAILLQAAWLSHRHIEKGLTQLHLELSEPKCNNMVLSPNSVVGVHYRRNNGLPARDRSLHALIETIQMDNTPAGGFPPNLSARRPYKCPPAFRVLGVQLDNTLGGAEHHSQVLRKACVRRGRMATLAQKEWGLEVGILRSAHSARLTSMATYGLAATGGTMYEGMFDRLEVQQANVSARKITGAARSARLAVLHIVADIITARNLFIQQCGIAIDRALRPHNSQIQTTTKVWLRGLYCVDGWEPDWYQLRVEEQLLTRTGRRGRDVTTETTPTPEQWTIRLLPKAPYLRAQEASWVSSIYHATAEEIIENPKLKGATYPFTNPQSSREVGFQVLMAVGWRPDQACAQKPYVQSLPQPQTHPRARLFFGHPEANAGLDKEEIYATTDDPPTDSNT